MAKCTKSDTQSCSNLFECKQQHYELHVVDWNNGGGEATQYFCINSMSPKQISLLQQLLKSVSIEQNSPLLDILGEYQSGATSVFSNGDL